jgi:CubicO group peptidase (beta-lactamase class C family)
MPIIYALAALLLLAVPAPAGEMASPPELSVVPVPQGQFEKALDRLDELAGDIMAKTGVPGMAVAVVKDGVTVYAKGFGVRKIGEPAKVDADTVFQIASLSKSLAGTVVAHEVGTGAVTWDTPIVKHLPWFALADPWVTQHVTIGDLFAHRSGLPDHAGDALEDLGYDRRLVLERLRLLPLAAFRETYAYTNFGLTAAAEAVAAADRKDWASLSDEVLYQLLGMSSTSSRFADFTARPNHAVGHVKVEGKYEAKYQRQPDPQSPAGGVSSSVHDLARWMAMVLGGGQLDGVRIIKEDALLPAITGQMIASPSTTAAARPGLYGYGFGVGVGASGRVTLNHSGAFALGAGTNFVMIPSLGVGVVVLTNASPTGAAESLAMSFTDLVQFGELTRDWLAAYAPLFAQMMAPEGRLVGAPPPANPAPAATLASYAGTYANAYFGDAEIALKDGRLALKLGPAGVTFPLTHWDGDVFVFSPSSENSNPGSISTATFTRGNPATLKVEYLDEDGLGTFSKK